MRIATRAIAPSNQRRRLFDDPEPVFAGAGVGAVVGATVGAAVGAVVGTAVGVTVAAEVGVGVTVVLGIGTMILYPAFVGVACGVPLGVVGEPGLLVLLPQAVKRPTTSIQNLVRRIYCEVFFLCITISSFLVWNKVKVLKDTIICLSTRTDNLSIALYHKKRVRCFLFGTLNHA